MLENSIVFTTCSFNLNLSKLNVIVPFKYVFSLSRLQLKANASKNVK